MAQQETGNVAAPDMPPAMAEIKKQSAEEVLAEMNRMPLFMTTLDETDGEGGENLLLEAMKALAYEGTRYEVAENFRQQGNECARAKQWNDAKEFYDKAIAALKGPQRKPDPDADAEGGQVIEVELDEEEEAKKEKVVEEASYVNRALCNLEKSELPASALFFLVSNSFACARARRLRMDANIVHRSTAYNEQYAFHRLLARNTCISPHPH